MSDYLARQSVDLISALEEFALFLDDDPSDVEESDEEPSGAFESLEQVGVIPSWQQIQITLRDVSYNFMTGREKKLNDKDEASNYAEIDSSKDSAKEDKKTAEQVKLKSITRKNDSMAHLEAKTPLIDGIIEVDEIEIPDDEDEEEPEDDIEEIGRLPSFHQFQYTLRNASEMISSSMFGGNNRLNNYEIPSILRAPDLLRKWGGPVSDGSLGWYNFMQNFQLLSFLNEEEKEEPVDTTKNPELYSEDGLTDSELAIAYSSSGLTGCDHYLRLCKSECNVCHKFYVCQVCHDEAETHEMDRRKVQRMLCMNCRRPQPPNRKCVFCKEVMGDYYCSECKLWNDDPDKQIYHCDKCKICRVGRGHNIDTFHCDKCGICMALTVKNNHKCIEQAANSGCPICLEDLFSSTKPTVFMPCGHPIHTFCFKEYTKRYYRCPICAKSIFDTSALFRMVDEEIKCEVLPPELANKRVRIVCQDCRLKSHTDYHLAGLKCETCGSYNTAQI